MHSEEINTALAVGSLKAFQQLTFSVDTALPTVALMCCRL